LPPRSEANLPAVAKGAAGNLSRIMSDRPDAPVFPRQSGIAAPTVAE